MTDSALSHGHENIRVHSRPFAACGVILTLFSLTFSQAFVQQSQSADLLLLDAHVVTVNSQQPEADAIAVKGGQTLWVGRNTEATKFFPAPRTLRLKGATILPGIIDDHTHLLSLGEGFLKLNLKDIPTEKEIVERVK